MGSKIQKNFLEMWTLVLQVSEFVLAIVQRSKCRLKDCGHDVHMHLIP